MPTPPPDPTSGQTTAASDPNVSNTQPLPPQQPTTTQTPQVPSTDAQTGQTQQPQPSGDTAPSSQTQQPQAQQPQAQHMVSNTLPSTLGTPAPPNSTVPADTPNAGHPLVQKAGVTNSVALALMGGPRYKTTIDPNTGETTRTQVPVSRAQVGLAIAMEAISGALAGFGVAPGPGAVGRAGAAGFQQGQQEVTQARQAQEQQAQTDLQNQTSALARAAQIHEVNSRTLLNTSEAEQQGADAIDKIVDINRQSGVLDTDPSNLLNNGVPMTQDELNDAMRKGTVNTTAQLGPVAGREEVTNPDGSKRWEATHLIIRDPNTPVSLTQDDWDRYAAAGVPGFRAGTKIGGSGAMVKLSMVQRANEIVASHYLADQRLVDLRDVLDGTPQAKDVPTSIDFSKPGVDTAVQRFQKYVSHNADNLNDPFLALQQMGADRRDPKTGVMQPNPDAKYVDAAAQAMGGWNVLEAAHNQITANKKTAADFAVIDSDAKANAVLAAPKRFSQDQVSSAKAFLAADRQQKSQTAGAEERARQAAKPSTVTPGSLTQPDALGFTPTVTDPKEANKRFNSFKKNADDLAKTEQTYSQFNDTLNDINAGKDLSGAASVVALFNAIGLSGTALKGQGFRVNENVIKEHEQARGWLGAVQQKALNVKAGDVITPQQIRDYASIAANARRNQYVAIANEAHNAGISANPFLPTGNGQKIDPNTASIFFQLSGNDPNRARQAAAQKGWSVQ